MRNKSSSSSSYVYIYIFYIYFIILNIYRRKRSCALKHTYYVGKSQKESLQECNCKQPCTNLALYTQSLTDSCCIRLLKACESDVVLHEVVLEAIVLRVSSDLRESSSLMSPLLRGRIDLQKKQRLLHGVRPFPLHQLVLQFRHLLQTTQHSGVVKNSLQLYQRRLASH